MLSSDIMRGYHDTMILSLLRSGDSYGYEISKAIELKSGGRYCIRETTLYSTFNRLEKLGYVTSYSGTESHGRRRTYYSITDMGRAYFQEKCMEWAELKEIMKLFVEEEMV
ncbi:MAG: PadR family transcriptional regulator [Butyricicoccaceae bacterium]